MVTGVGVGSLGEAIASSLREVGFRVLTSTRTCETTADTHAMELTSRDSVVGVRPLGDRQHRPARRAGQQRRGPPRPALGLARAAPGRRHGGALAHQLPRHRPADPAAGPAAACHGADAGDARVVNVVSKLHARGRNDGLDGHLTPYDSWTAYGTSKLALVHEAHEIERRYGGRGLHGYSRAPGLGGHQHRRPRPRDRTAAGAAAQAGRAPRAARAQGTRPTPPAPWSSARRRPRPSRVATTAPRRRASPRRTRRTRRPAGSCGRTPPAGASAAEPSVARRAGGAAGGRTHRQLW